MSRFLVLSVFLVLSACATAPECTGKDCPPKQGQGVSIIGELINPWNWFGVF